MFFIKYGIRKVNAGVYQPSFFQCPNCKSINSVSFGIESTYFHVWYIPVFPTEKDGFARCDSCDFKVNSIKYNKQTRDEYRQVIRKKVKHPFYVYTISLIFGGLIVAGILVSILN
jgi:transcription elongation factor Elf1